MRTGLAILAAALLALVAVAPHAHHADALGSHACQACVLQGGAEAASAAPDLAPARVAVGAAPAEPAGSQDAGFPQGAVPGQSPPRAGA